MKVFDGINNFAYPSISLSPGNKLISMSELNEYFRITPAGKLAIDKLCLLGLIRKTSRTLGGEPFFVINNPGDIIRSKLKNEPK
jgi:hypothetical protein